MHLETNAQDHFCAPNEAAIPIRCYTDESFKASGKDLTKDAFAWAKANGFSGKSGQHCLIPSKNGAISCVLFGLGSGEGDGKSMSHAKLARLLPKGDYAIEGADEQAKLAWAMGGYSFDRYRARNHKTPRLSAEISDETSHIADAVFLTRDLINIPANDMGPVALEAAFRKLAATHKATVEVIVGDALLEKNFPMVHAVGRASAEAPRVLDLHWGDPSHPKVTLVGKGVTFDTGGLNIKPGSSMALMKKDMGGAANVMGLAHMIMANNVPIRLRLIVGAVENSISANAFRPGDILSSRKGLSVEIGNTDAEGRLVLGDCLALGDEDHPDMMIDMATLTGAARVALGPDLPPFYTNNNEFAAAAMEKGNAVNDPLWRMPLWQPYQSMLASKIANVNHISSGGFAGSITAALFLSRFVENANVWAHFDIYGWVPSAKPWAPIGGEAQGIRSIYEVIKEQFSK